MQALQAQAAPTAAPVRTEITGLLQRLEASGCQFNRNGDWHVGAEARGHLLRKLDYLEDRRGASPLRSAEQFIELAASRSSMSGKPYLVRCAGAAPVPSQDWLNAQLRLLRQPPATPAVPPPAAPTSAAR